MAQSIFNETSAAYLESGMFLDDQELGVARYDHVKYPAFQKNTETQRSFIWNPNEINLSQDKIDFKAMTQQEQHIFLSNLKAQIFLDSAQQRGVLQSLLPYVTLPELEGAVIWWGAFEQIHSESYTHMIRNVLPPDVAASVFEDVLQIQEILSRSKVIRKYYDEFIEYAKLKDLFGYGTVRTSTQAGERIFVVERKELYRRLYLLLVSIYALEGIRFFVSFACNFAFDKLHKMRGSAKVMQLIARDENQHLAITLLALRNYRTKENDTLMLEVIAECEEEARQILHVVAQQEMDWATYLFKDGAILGLNEAILHQYIQELTNKRLKDLHLKPLFPAHTGTLPWMRDYLEQDRVQRAKQEEEATSYIMNGIVNDVTADTEFRFNPM